MRIVYDHTIFARQRHGGISRYFFELASHAACKHDVLISAPVYSNSFLKNSPRLCRGLYADWGWGTGTVADVVGRIFGPLGLSGTDVLHETFYSQSSPYRTPTGKRVTTVHDMTDELFYPDRDVVRMKRASIDRADLVLCVSKRTRDDLLSLIPIEPERVKVIRLGYELRVGHEATGSERHLPVPYVLHVGPRGEYKNFALTLRVFASSERLRRDVGLVCFGGPDITPAERKAVHAAGIAPARFLHLRGDDRLLARCYRDATALVVPALYEGFGIPLLEAMSLGCPVCTSDRGALAEIAGDAALLFDPDDEEACRSAMLRVTDDAALRNTLRQRGFAHVRNFGWQKCADETCAAYMEL